MSFLYPRLGVECPSFQVLRVYRFGIQKRRYFDTMLVSAASNECEFNSVSIWRGFMPLHLYKHGNHHRRYNQSFQASKHAWITNLPTYQHIIRRHL